MFDPTTAETVTLAEAISEVAEEYDTLEERYEAAENPDQIRAAVEFGLNDLDLMGKGLGALAEAYGPEATLTVRGLHAGEFGLVEDRVAKKRQQDGGGPRQGYHRTVYAAAGLVDAPFFDPDGVESPPYDERSKEGRLDARIGAVAQQDIGTVKWLYAQVDDRTTPDEGNWRRFAGSTTAEPAE